MLADYEIFEAPSRWDCPEYTPDGVLMAPATTEAWRASASTFGGKLAREAWDLRTYNDLREMAFRLEAFARRLRESADLLQSLDVEYAETQHIARARWRRLTGREIAPLGDVTRARRSAQSEGH